MIMYYRLYNFGSCCFLLIFVRTLNFRVLILTFSYNFFRYIYIVKNIEGDGTKMILERMTLREKCLRKLIS